MTIGSPHERLIVALDQSELALSLTLVERLGDAVVRYKVGLELYIAAGPRAVAELVARGKRVFLDLKLHDIPETVGRAGRAAASLGIDLLTVHAAGGRAMMGRAVEAVHAAGCSPRPRVLAVTVLTSLERAELAEDGQDGTVEDLVLRRARLAIAAGCDGVVASPNEVAMLRRTLGQEILIVTPGVRPHGVGSAVDDQKRVATPGEARAAGADAIVVGRPIRDAVDPLAAVQTIVAQLAAVDGV